MSGGEEICSMENYKAEQVKKECGLRTGIICLFWVVTESLCQWPPGYDGQARHIRGGHSRDQVEGSSSGNVLHMGRVARSCG